MAALISLGLSGAPATPAAPRSAAPAALRVRNAFEAAQTTRRASRWLSSTVSPNDAVLANLRTLRDRSRLATRNDGYAKGVIDHRTTNIVGTGIKPLSQAPDRAMRTLIHELFERWTDESDADGLLDFYGQQSQLVRARDEGGETFIRLRPRLPQDGLSVPLQLQVLEPELCPHDHNITLTPQGTKVRAGIEFDVIGRRVAYWFYTQRPGDWQDYDPSDLRQVPAATVIHFYDPLRPGQLRGLPHLTQALLKLHELDKFDDAVLMRQQISNLFAAFVRRPATTGETGFDPLTGTAVDASVDDDHPLVSMEPATVQELNPGEEIEFADPPDAGQTYESFMRQQLYHVAAATGVPYEVLTGDMSKVNDRTVRVILHEFRRGIEAYQHQQLVFQVCRRVWRAWMDQAFLSGALPLPSSYATNPEPWLAVKWIPQAWPYINPVQDVQATRDEIRAGLKSRSSAISDRGEDAEQVDEEQATDNARAEKLGLIHDSNARYTSQTGVAQAADPSAQGAV